MSCSENPHFLLQSHLLQHDNYFLLPSKQILRLILISLITTEGGSDMSTLDVSITEQRRSTRNSKAHLWMKDYVAAAKLKSGDKPAYFIDIYVAYDHLHTSYQKFLSKFGNNVEPSTFEEVCSDQRWVEAMTSEISALDATTLGLLFHCLQARRLLGANGCSRSSI